MERVCAKRRRLTSGASEESANSSAAALSLPEPPPRRIPTASVTDLNTRQRIRPSTRHSRPRRRLFSNFNNKFPTNFLEVNIFMYVFTFLCYAI